MSNDDQVEVPQTATIGGQEIRLGAPPSLTIRFEIVSLAAKNGLRAKAAALGVCWVAGGSPKAPRTRYAADPAAYGQEVCDELLKRGIPLMEILDAGSRAISKLWDGLPSVRGVEAQEDFSEAPEGGSTSSS